MGKRSHSSEELSEEGPARPPKKVRVDLAAAGIARLEASSRSDWDAQNANFRRWLREEKDKSISRMNDATRDRYFDKYARAFNKGKLPQSYYAAPAATGPQQGLSHLPPAADRPKWSHVDALQYQRSVAEDEEERRRWISKQSAKKERKERKAEVEADRATGKDRLQEDRMALRMSNRAFADAKHDQDIEFKDDVLMGGNDSFQKALAARNAARKRSAARRGTDEANAEMADKKQQYQERESALMASFREMAAGRFGT